ncbi:hypothetical protein [Polymorphobacter fuscus]|uniref:Acyltransferase family protein n=1 Tax=Sandarakinorhabdus fusca TaxID=1439888 RepID=A0A7C9GP40_9SPHN|nr:hypothetical protein [Polymorphobacter fuscus]KAB7647919.1 hypothetical protein F9290_08165 [Polymorphobacter fuscus]MQT17237.1 hypothetical protein [Polymorphobacter fuscus]
MVAVLFAYQGLEVSTSYGRFANTPIWILPALLVPALFAIAGFLLARSLDRGDFRDFWRRRLLRSWPTLAFAVVATALVIGPLATRSSLARYFSDRDLALYFLNLVAIPFDRLPEVFTTNPVGSVNDILRVVPFALVGSIILAVSSLRPRWGTAVPAIAIGVATAVALLLPVLAASLPANLPVVQAALNGWPLTAFLCLLLGALAWRQRRRLVLHKVLAAAAAMLLLVVAVAGRRDWNGIAAFHLLIALPLTYLVVTLALARLPFAGPAAAVHKYLAGFVLMAWPVQQLVISSRLVGEGFFASTVASLPLAVLLAVAGWHGVQKPLFRRSGGIEGNSGLAIRAARPLTLAGIWQRSAERAPELAMWVAFLLAAMAAMAMTMVAFSPESGGV